MSVALGQGQLLTPAPTRRLRVVAGHCCWWGVDTAVRRVAIGWVDGAGERGAFTISLPDLTGGQRLAFAFDEIRDQVAARVRAGTLPRPGIIVTEQASGGKRNLPLEYMVGVVQGAVYAGAVKGGASPPRTETVASAKWKLRACGTGRIDKPSSKNKLVTYGVLDHARAVWGYTGSSWDEADGLGIAESARRDLALVEL